MPLSPRAVSISTVSSPILAQASPCPVTFSPDPVKAGYTNPAASSTLKVTLTATVTPKEDVVNYTLKRGGAVPTRIDLANLQPPNPQTGKISVDVLGRILTPATNQSPDTTIDAWKDGVIVCSVPVWVLIPRAVGIPHPTADSSVSPVNQLATGATSPAYFGSLGQNQVVLWTYWAQWLSVPVVDQFINPLIDLYNGQPVAEYSGSAFKPINQNIAGGTYQDPVFVFRYKNNQATPYIVAANSQEAQAWPSAPPASFPPGTYGPQEIRVTVAGHEIGRVVLNVQGQKQILWPAVAIHDRSIVATSPSNVKIVWPQT